MAELLTRWDNSAFFSGSDDPEIANTVDSMRAEIDALSTHCEQFSTLIESAPATSDYPAIVAALETAYDKQVAIGRTLGNTSMFIHCCLSVNARDAAASTWLPTLQQLGARLKNATHPMFGYLARADDAVISLLSQSSTLSELSFQLEQLREMSDQLLPVEQEQLLTRMAVTGLHGWGNLYKNLSGTLQCTVGNEQLGLAAAANQLSNADRTTREQAWRGINTAWTDSEQSAAAILNNINGWRIEEATQRAHTRKLHYLDKSCHSSRISRKTLDAMMAATHSSRSIPQRAMAAMAKLHGIDQLEPWDLMAPAPIQSSGAIDFSDAINTISQSFAQFSAPMGEFVIEMAERGWIDSEQTDNRSTGAYCGAFAEPRQPRIFITYNGTLTNVITLAHELGHAWHNRVMEDIPEAKIQYPMTLAETASIFAETLVRDSLLDNAKDDQQRLEIMWSEAETAAALMLNIPARFEFEQRLVETRQDNFVTADAMKNMMRESWKLWYEDSLTEYDEMFWASKLHFSISGFGFYNYPYLFGYLFSLGIYAQKDAQGNTAKDRSFEEKYLDILRDTGSMTAEDLVQKHLGQDITTEQFWLDSIGIVERSVQQFEKLAGAA
jgi:oligoendopeptidase F